MACVGKLFVACVIGSILPLSAAAHLVGCSRTADQPSRMTGRPDATRSVSDAPAPQFNPARTNLGSTVAPLETGAVGPVYGSPEFIRLLVPMSLPGFSAPSVLRYPVLVPGNELPQTGATASYSATDASGLHFDLWINRTSEPIDAAEGERRLRVGGHTVMQGERRDHVYAGWRNGDWAFTLSILSAQEDELTEARRRVGSLVRAVTAWVDPQLARSGH